MTHPYTNCSNFVRLKSSLLPSKLTVPYLSPSLMGGKPTARYWYQITVFSVCWQLLIVVLYSYPFFSLSYSLFSIDAFSSSATFSFFSLLLHLLHCHHLHYHCCQLLFSFTTTSSSSPISSPSLSLSLLFSPVTPCNNIQHIVQYCYNTDLAAKILTLEAFYID